MRPFRTREVVLPRFKLEQNYDLIENLKEMGLTDLFQESGDFSGMTSEKVAMNWVSRTKSVSHFIKKIIIIEHQMKERVVGHLVTWTSFLLQSIIPTNYFKIMMAF